MSNKRIHDDITDDILWRAIEYGYQHNYSLIEIGQTCQMYTMLKAEFPKNLLSKYWKMPIVGMLKELK